MQVDPYIILGSAVVGFLVGMTGAGGGALMTPMLILLFGVRPSAAISSDLVAAVVMRPIGAAVHLRRGTVNLRLVGWIALGSVPMAFVGPYLLHLVGHTNAAERGIEAALGAALLVGAAAMVVRYGLDRRAGKTRGARVHDLEVRPLPTVLIGMAGGFIVGMTSVGAGSLMIVLLLFVYPLLGAKQLVGTDLTQAVPLTIAAALGALVFGHVELYVTLSVIIGSVPAVVVGSFLSSSVPDRYIRPAVTFVIFASGLKYVGVGTTTLGWILCGTLLASGAVWLVHARPWREGGLAAPVFPSRILVAGPEPERQGGSMGAVLVRHVQAHEWGLLKELRLAALSESPHAFASTYGKEAAFGDEVWRERAGQPSRGKARTNFVAELDGKAVGLVAALLEGESERAEVLSMWTSPSSRRLGAGRALLDGVITWAREAGATEVQLWVTVGNAAARSLYESAGFRLTDDFQALPSDPSREERRMTLRLAENSMRSRRG